MIRKALGIFTSVVAAMAVVGVAWAAGDVMSGTDRSTSSTPVPGIELDDSTTSTGAITPEVSTPTTVRSTTSTSDDDGSSSSSSTPTSIVSTTSTSVHDTTSTSSGTSTTSTTVGSSTSTSLDDNDRAAVPDGVTTYQLAGVGSITIEVFEGQLYLSSVSAPGWEIEEQRVEPDRIEVELVSGDAEAEFEARIKHGRVDVETEIDLD